MKQLTKLEQSATAEAALKTKDNDSPGNRSRPHAFRTPGGPPGIGNLLALVLALGVLSPGVKSSAQAVHLGLHDETFLPAHWQFYVAGGQNVSSVQVYQDVGAGVTGNAQRTIVNGFSPIQYDVRHYSTNLAWLPGVHGTITNIADWQLWYKVQGECTYGILELAAAQGAGHYVAGATYWEPQNFNAYWQRAHGSIPATAFTLSAGSGPTTLDFSPSAPPIYFGYRNFSSVNLRCSSVTHRISFFDLQIDGVAPAPVAFTLGGFERLASGSYRFTFTNTPAILFTVIATTNVASPVENWPVVGAASEVAPGRYQWTFTPATNQSSRLFFRVRAP